MSKNLKKKEKQSYLIMKSQKQMRKPKQKVLEDKKKYWMKNTNERKTKIIKSGENISNNY